jgi:hypothetical protein
MTKSLLVLAFAALVAGISTRPAWHRVFRYP